MHQGISHNNCWKQETVTALQHFRRSNGFCNLTNKPNGTSLKWEKKTPSEKQNSITICSGNIPETSGEATFFTLSAVFPQPHIHLCGQKAAKTTFYNIRTNSAESPSLQPSTMERWSVFPGAACPSSLLPWLHLCRAYTALPQPWQHPRTVVRNLVCGVLGSCTILCL